MVELESQLDETVVSSTKTARRASKAPAVVTVVTAEEIQARGYTCLADILRTVPGFYDVYDQVFHNVGIRGVNGGARASGNVLKLMIDGQAVHFRPSTGNFFGEELVPLSAVSRVEIIRGPGSALYGANAFLGVVNVITRSGADHPGARVTGVAGLQRERTSAPSWGAEGLLAGGDGSADFLVAASAYRFDRSGLSLPETSPMLHLGGDHTLHEAGSEDDLARPRSVLARASVGTLDSGRVTLLATVQQLDAGGEFQDLAPLTHRTRIALQNQTYRLTYELEPLPSLAVKASGSWFDSGPLPEERVNLGRPDQDLLRNAGAYGYEVAAEARVIPGSRWPSPSARTTSRSATPSRPGTCSWSRSRGPQPVARCPARSLPARSRGERRPS